MRKLYLYNSCGFKSYWDGWTLFFLSEIAVCMNIEYSTHWFILPVQQTVKSKWTLKSHITSNRFIYYDVFLDVWSVTRTYCIRKTRTLARIFASSQNESNYSISFDSMRWVMVIPSFEIKHISSLWYSNTVKADLVQFSLFTFVLNI